MNRKRWARILLVAGFSTLVGCNPQAGVPDQRPPVQAKIKPDHAFTTYNGVEIESHQNRSTEARSKTSIYAKGEPLPQEVNGGGQKFVHKWTIKFGHLRGFPKNVTVKVWDHDFKMYPGWNSPIIEVFDGEKRLAVQDLEEVGMPTDVWAASHFYSSNNGHEEYYLYVSDMHRRRIAGGTHVYLLNKKTGKFEHRGIVFQRDHLENAVIRINANKN